MTLKEFRERTKDLPEDTMLIRSSRDQYVEIETVQFGPEESSIEAFHFNDYGDLREHFSGYCFCDDEVHVDLITKFLIVW